MLQIPVKMENMLDAKRLVQIANGMKGDVELVCGRYTIDAKSMLGVFSLPNLLNVQLQIHEEDIDKEDEIKEKLRSFSLIRE